MYRPYYCLVFVLLANGCASIGSNAQSSDPAKSAAYDRQQKQALFDQPYIDPLTDYLIEHSAEVGRQDMLKDIREERDRRCESVFRDFTQAPATSARLAQFNAGYAYSCPQQVAEFEARVIEATAEKTTPKKTDTETVETRPTAKPETAIEPVVSDQALSDCYLLTAIRNFSEAKTACREPAEKGDVRSQANMAKVAYAFEDYVSALEWARKAVSASGDAAFLLAEMYRKGQGVDQNSDQALHWYTEAARQGNAQAQTALERYQNADTDH